MKYWKKKRENGIEEMYEEIMVIILPNLIKKKKKPLQGALQIQIIRNTTKQIFLSIQYEMATNRNILKGGKEKKTC